MKLNLGCGKRVLDGYINVDANPYRGTKTIRADLLDYLRDQPFDTVSLILMDHVLEHMPFEKEKDVFYWAKAALEPGGKLVIRVPDFKWLCYKFLKAKDTGYEFYRRGAKDHYFGGGHDINKRWSYLVASFYGNQNGPGEFHQNCYTTTKFKHIAKMADMRISVRKYFRRTARFLEATFTKRH